MSAALEQVIEDIEALSVKEKAYVAHRLLSDLEEELEDGVEEAWQQLAEKRLNELDSGKVQGISWGQIKSQLKEK